MKTSALLLLVLIAGPAAAQPAAPKAPAPGSVYPAPATLPKDRLPTALAYARASKGFPAVPDKVTPTVVGNIDVFVGHVEQIRRELDNAAIVLNALQSDDMKALIGDAERQQLIKQMTDDFTNRNAWLDKMQTAFVDTHFPKPAPRYDGPSIGLPSRPTRGAYVPRSAAGIIAERGFPGGPGASLHPVTRAISTGWTAGAWVGNEVMIKEELRASWKAQDDLKKAQKDWDANVKPVWEENRRREREDRERADADAARRAPTMGRIFQALFMRPFIVTAPAPNAPKPSVSSLPYLPPSFGTPGGFGPYGGGPLGTYSGGSGYSGGRYYGSTGGVGGNGPYGGGYTGTASGAGMSGALGR